MLGRKFFSFPLIHTRYFFDTTLLFDKQAFLNYNHKLMCEQHKTIEKNISPRLIAYHLDSICPSVKLAADI